MNRDRDRLRIAMRVLTIRAHGGPDQLMVAQREMPQPGPGEIRIRVAAAGVNRADLLQRRGVYPPPQPYDPMCLGLEYAGRVDSVGPGVTRPAVGDRVMGLIPGGAQAEYVVVPAQETIPVPAGLDLSAAAAVPEAFLTAFDALYLQGGLQEGHPCLVRGASSGIGIAGCQLAHSFGNRCIGTTRAEAKCDRLQQVGATHALVDDAALRERVTTITHGAGVNVVMDLVGGPALDSNIAMLAQRGVVVCVGLLGGTQSTINLMQLLTRRARVIGTVMRSRPAAERVQLAQSFQEQVLPMFASSALSPVIADILSLDDAAAAHEMMEANRHFGKLVLQIADLD